MKEHFMQETVTETIKKIKNNQKNVRTTIMYLMQYTDLIEKVDKELSELFSNIMLSREYQTLTTTDFYFKKNISSNNRILTSDLTQNSLKFSDSKYLFNVKLNFSLKGFIDEPYKQLERQMKELIIKGDLILISARNSDRIIEFGALSNRNIIDDLERVLNDFNTHNCVENTISKISMLDIEKVNTIPYDSYIYLN